MSNKKRNMGGGVFKYLPINKTKGFTLIELLAVIVVLAVIATIAVPVVLNIIESARIGAFRSSIYGLEKAAELYTVSSDYNEKEKLEFICNSNACETSDGKKLNFKGEVPIGGSIIIENNIITMNYIKNNSYCALGTRENLDIQKDCTKLDITEAELILETSKVSSNSILVRVRTTDNESGIKNIEYLINDKSKSVEDKKLIGMVEETYLFEDLDKNTEYEIKVKVTNGNNKETEKTINITTEEINNPSITYTNTPNDSIDGYLERQVINVTFNNSNITTPSYYIKTTRKGTSNINVTESCGTGVEPGNCTNITSTNVLNANTWYKAIGNVNVTYSEPSDTTDTLYAITYDGRNYSGASTGVISKIIQPAAGISLNMTSATLENGSTLQLYATITPSNTTNKTVTWTTSDINIATIDGNGLVTGRFAGTVTITAMTNNGLKASTNITFRDYLSNVVNVGDYVAYDAGTWTSSAPLPTSQGQFGGYTLGWNKANSVSLCANSYDFPDFNQATSLKGWRVLSVDKNTNIVTIIHAGQPECYYHSVNYQDASVANLNNRTVSEYLNYTYASSAHNMTYDEAFAITGSTGFAENNLRRISSWYWLANPFYTGVLYCTDHMGHLNSTNGFNQSFGVRPVVVLKSNIKTTGKTIDAVGQEAWNLIAP